ncbi:hypothetical protein EAH89_29565 [Roseomonas nepalensis]|uniref:Uncharacterized protein n=2 Tax=Muricoccus nepalensis TaxID=1854500 RepID=A0A502ENI3_9PROT|nr:hypothetical protein EAH89_29565 [Roseomonas nepalensis]
MRVGRPAFAPTEKDRSTVKAMAGFGIPEVEIAKILSIDPKTLRKYFPHELDVGHVEANAKVAANLFRRATGDGREAVIAAIFWLKCRAGWREQDKRDAQEEREARKLGRHEQALLNMQLTSSEVEWADDLR